MKLVRREAAAPSRIGEPILDDPARFHPAVRAQQAVDARGDHVHAVVGMVPAVGRVACDAEPFADELIERLAEALVEHAFECRVAPFRIVLADDARDQRIATQCLQSGARGGAVHRHLRMQHLVRGDAHRRRHIVVERLQEYLALDLDAVRLRVLQQHHVDGRIESAAGQLLLQAHDVEARELLLDVLDVLL